MTARLQLVDPAAPAPARRGGGKATAEQLLERPHALLTRSHLAELGLGRRAIDAVFRELPVVKLPGYAFPHVRVADYLDLLERSTYRDDRVRPTR